MVLRNRKTRRNRKTLRTLLKHKTRRNRHKTRGGNTTDPLYTTNHTIDDVPITPVTYATIPGFGSVPVTQLQEHVEHRAQEAY